MNKLLKITMLMVLLVLCGGNAIAQIKTDDILFPTRENEDSLRNELTKYKVQMLIRTYGDSIVIRWAPYDAGVWMSAIPEGWALYRSSDHPGDTVFSVDQNGDTLPFRLMNNGQSIVAMTLDEMMENFDSTDVYAGAAAQAMYGTMHYNINKDLPNDNNDLVFQVYKQSQEQTQRQFMAYLAAECDPRVGSAMGLRYVDKQVRPGGMYQYYLTSRLPHDFLPVDPVSKVVVNEKFVRSEDEDVPAIHIEQIDIYKAAIRWDKNQLAGYFLERSSDNGKTWERLNTKSPLWPMDPDSATYRVYGDSIASWMETQVVYLDSLDLTKTYVYRVRAFDAFGDRTEWRKSEKFKMTDFEPPLPPILHSVTPENNQRCHIKWVKPGNEKDYIGSMVMFAPTNQGPWKAVTDKLSKSVLEFTDEYAQQRGRGYYRIFAFDTAGNISYSAAMLNYIEDVTPPARPTRLNYATADSTGVVYLEWKANHDEDLQAYKVYYANQRDHEFIERSKGYITDTFFLDTLNLTSLTLDVYYYVVAVDNNNNYSYPSDTLRVLLPDFLPPTPPILEKTHQANDSVVLTWIGSASTDVENYYIYRKFREAKNWECINILPGNAPDRDNHIRFVDFPAPSRHPYTYAIEAVDSSRNSSGKNGTATIVVRESNLVNLEIKLKASYDKKAGGVALKINYKYDTDRDYYGVVYRSVNGGTFEDIGTFRRGDNSYLDTNAPADKECTYYVQLQLGHGRYTSASNNATVKTK